MLLMCHLNFILEANSDFTGKLSQYIDSFAWAHSRQSFCLRGRKKWDCLQERNESH